jgi:hypothetical protein
LSSRLSPRSSATFAASCSFASSAVLLLEYLADLFDEVGRDRHGGSGLSLEHERTLGGLGGFLRRDVTLFGHAPKDVVVAAIDVLFGIAERAQARGRRNDCDD